MTFGFSADHRTFDPKVTPLARDCEPLAPTRWHDSVAIYRRVSSGLGSGSIGALPFPTSGKGL